MIRLSSVVTVLLVLFTISPIYAQPFQRSMGSPLNERANCIEHTADSGYIIAGTEKEVLDV